MGNQQDKPSYTLRRADIANEAGEVLRLWLAAYPEMDPAYARRKLEGQYLRSPAGPGICLFLEHGADESPVGVQCLGLRRFAYRGQPILGGIFADYVVDLRHRSLGPALTLLKGTLAAGNEASAILYGFPNEKSEVVFRRIGMRSPGSITRFVRLLRSKPLLARRLHSRWQWLLPFAAGAVDTLLAIELGLKRLAHARRWSWSEQREFDGFFDDCWNAGRRDEWLTGERSRETLEWRFPTDSDRIISVAAEPDNGTRQGYIVWRRGGAAIYILDAFCRQPEQQLAGLLAGFASRMRKAGAESISFEFAGPRLLEDAIRESGYRPRDRHPFFLSADSHEPIRSLPIESMYLTAFDRD
jgi:hypothetical protein